MNYLQLDNIKKIALFSDIHWGKNKDNIIKLNSLIEYINWFLQKCKENNVDLIIFCGDWFDNRNSININTLNISYKILQKIAKKFPIYLIIGNHDTTLKNSTKIHSLISFYNIPNVKIIEENLELNINNHKILLVPWNGQIPENKYDLLIGHFEFTGAQLANNNYFNEKVNYNIESLCNIAPLVFSGHFHIHKEYNYGDKKLIVIGSPLQLDWGDYNNEKGFYIYNLQNRTYEFIENNISPIYVKIYLSKIKNNFNEVITDKLINKNYIKLIVDQMFKYDDISKIINYINSLSPIKPCEVDFLFDILQQTEDINFNNEKDIKKSKFDYIKLYIEKMNDDIFNNCNLTKDIVINKAQLYYNKVEEEIINE